MFLVTANQTIVITLIIHMQLIQKIKILLKDTIYLMGKKYLLLSNIKISLDVNFIQKKWKKRSKSIRKFSDKINLFKFSYYLNKVIIKASLFKFIFKF